MHAVATHLCQIFVKFVLFQSQVSKHFFEALRPVALQDILDVS